MTNEEAITYANCLKNNYTINFEDMADFCDMAIKALEQEPCENCISRQVVKERMIKYGFHAPDMTVTEFVEDLPPATPHYTDAEIQKMQELEQAEIQKAYELGKASQPKTGHWNTYVVSRGGINEEWLECSECMWSNALVIPRNYCPNCGARMIESEE